MAEAGVGEQPPTTSGPSRFYCHVCNTEIIVSGVDYTCPLCTSGFIEELPPQASNERSNLSITDDNSFQSDDHVTLGFNFGETQNFTTLDDMFLDFLGAMSRGNIRISDQQWGREGISSVVNRLLNHGTTSYGPPPLPKDKIDEIPTVKITETDIAQKSKCSVCLEDFLIGENVRQLLCLHVYHENCIVPWLGIHGTCPMCRKILQPDVRRRRSILNSTSSSSAASEVSIPGGTETFNVTSTQPGISGETFEDTTENERQPMDTPSPPPETADDSRRRRGAGFFVSSYTMSYDDGNVDYDFD